MDPDKLITIIRQEFHKTPAPTPPDWWENFTDDISSPNYAEAIEETKPFWGKDWDALTLQDFDDCRGVFNFLPEDALPFFLGGYMVLSINENEFGSMAFDHFCYYEPISKKSKKIAHDLATIRTYLKRVSNTQREVIANYLDFRVYLKVDYKDTMAFMQKCCAGKSRQPSGPASSAGQQSVTTAP